MYLITVEGGDGSGKGEAVRILANLANKMAFPKVHVTHEPRRHSQLGKTLTNCTDSLSWLSTPLPLVNAVLFTSGYRYKYVARCDPVEPQALGNRLFHHHLNQQNILRSLKLEEKTNKQPGKGSNTSVTKLMDLL